MDQVLLQAKMINCRKEIKSLLGGDNFTFRPTKEGAIFACFQKNLPANILKNLSNSQLPAQEVIICQDNGFIKIIAKNGPNDIVELLTKCNK